MNGSVYEFACDELRDLDRKAQAGDLQLSDIQYADMLEHYKKSKLTADAMERADGEYSRHGGYNDGGTFARERDSRGRYSARSYARDDGLSRELRALMPMARDEQTRMEMQRLAEKVERM